MKEREHLRIKESKPDAISQIALVGSVTFFMARIAWDVITAQWMHLWSYVSLFVLIIWLYIRIVGIPDDEEAESPPTSKIDSDHSDS